MPEKKLFVQHGLWHTFCREMLHLISMRVVLNANQCPHAQLMSHVPCMVIHAQSELFFHFPNALNDWVTQFVSGQFGCRVEIIVYLSSCHFWFVLTEDGITPYKHFCLPHPFSLLPLVLITCQLVNGSRRWSVQIGMQKWRLCFQIYQSGQVAASGIFFLFCFSLVLQFMTCIHYIVIGGNLKEIQCGFWLNSQWLYLVLFMSVVRDWSYAAEFANFEGLHWGCFLFLLKIFGNVSACVRINQNTHSTVIIRKSNAPLIWGLLGSVWKF